VFPGSGALMLSEFVPSELRRVGYLVKAGYAIVFPIYKGTYHRPMFEMLGTPAEHKSWKTYPGAHSVPRVVMIREVLRWLDRYLGAR